MSAQKASEITLEVSEITPEVSQTTPEVPETTPEVSETLSELSEATNKLFETKLEVPDDISSLNETFTYMNNYFSSPDVKEFIEMCKYIPSWLLIENYEQEFDPKVILSYIENSDKHVMEKDINMLVKIGIEEGNNLEKIYMKLLPELKDKFNRFKIKYNLVSKAKKNKHAVTLSRIYESVPITTCLYLKHDAKNPTVSFEVMESICKNYPRVMMTSAFAYLIPNKEDEFCLFLKKAHLLHQYQFFDTISSQSHPRLSVDLEDKFISKVYVKTQAAINESHIEYDIQIKFLKENDLIVEGENEITVTEIVGEAVKLWDQKVRDHEIHQMYPNGAYEDYIM